MWGTRQAGRRQNEKCCSALTSPLQKFIIRCLQITPCWKLSQIIPVLTESELNQSCHTRLLVSTTARSDLRAVGLSCLVLHDFFLCFSVEHISLLCCFCACMSCLPAHWELFVGRKGFQKLVRLIDLDWLLGLALRIQKKALFKEPGVQKHPLCHLFPKWMSEGGARPVWAPRRAAWRWSRALEGPTETLNSGQPWLHQWFPVWP